MNAKKKMTLTEYAKSLSTTAVSEKVQLVQDIMRITGKTEVTVYRWISGKVSPAPLEKTAIAEFLKSDVATLFPN